MKRSSGNKRTWMAIVLITGSILCFIWFILFRAFTPIYKQPILLEYGDLEITKEDLLEAVSNNKKITLEEVPEIENTPSEQEIEVTFQKGLRKQTETIPIQIKDTKPPIINVVQPQIEIAKGDTSKSPEDNIIEIKDPVDGAIENIQRGTLQECDTFLYNRMFKTDCVFIGTDFDIHVSGDYEVKIVSYDVAGNEAIHSYIVKVMDDSLPRSNDAIDEIVASNTCSQEEDENDSLFINTYFPNYVMDKEVSYYTFEEDAKKALALINKQAPFMHIQTITGLHDDTCSSYTYYALLPNTDK